MQPATKCSLTADARHLPRRSHRPAVAGVLTDRASSREQPDRPGYPSRTGRAAALFGVPRGERSCASRLRTAPGNRSGAREQETITDGFGVPMRKTAKENVGRGRSSRTTPPRYGCLRCTYPAPDGGSPGPAVQEGSRQRDPAVIGPTLTVAVGQATTVPPARHSTRWGAGESRLWSCAREVRCPARVVVLPPAARGACSAAGGRECGVAGDPSTSRSGARTFAGSPATWRLLSLRGRGESHEIHGETASSMELITVMSAREGQSSGRQRSGGHGPRGNKVFVCGPPHAAQRRTRSPAARTLRTATPRIRRMGSEQGAPSMGQARQLTARQRQQRPIIGSAYQLVEHVEPLPHCPLEHLAQNLVHALHLPAVQVAYQQCPRHEALIAPSSTYKVWSRLTPVMGWAAVIGQAIPVNGPD